MTKTRTARRRTCKYATPTSPSDAPKAVTRGSIPERRCATTAIAARDVPGWTRSPKVAVVPSEYTSLIVGAVDASLLGAVGDQGQTWADPTDGRLKRQVPTPAGRVTLATPITGIRPRRWLTVTIAAAERLGYDGVERALDPSTFHELETEVLTPGTYVECPTCGALITIRGLKNHQATNAVCAWSRAATEVRTAWAAGWRDPYSVHDAPLTWGELRAKACWRDQLCTILFPRWIAVLLPTTTVDARSSAPRSVAAR